MFDKFHKNFGIIILLAVFTLTACSTVPLTGRSQLNLVPSSTILSMSFSQYNQFLKKNKVSSNKKQTAMVKRVGNKIQKAVELYFAQRGLTSELAEYKWEFNLVKNDAVNAWCMPGGKVVVYTGMLPVTKNETGLAVVMGHEIAHALAKHGNERMSQGMLTQIGGLALSEALKKKPDQARALWLAAYGLGSQVGVMLPFSRLHESEADHLGLIFMAMAGYNPEEAISFWKRMAATKKGGTPPEFLSTHPSDVTRINDLKKLMPEAKKYYRKK